MPNSSGTSAPEICSRSTRRSATLCFHAWVTEGLTPGVVACSHHLGRWRVNKDEQIERMSSAWVDLKEVGKGQWKMRQLSGVKPYDSPDPDTKRVWWSDAGVQDRKSVVEGQKV